MDGSTELHKKSQREEFAETSSKVDHIRSHLMSQVETQDQANSFYELARAGSPAPDVDSGSTGSISFAETEEDSRMDLEDAPDSSQPIRTPCRKRQRVMEVAASDSESDYDMNSQVRCPNSTPRRPYKRIRTPNSESRRQSAPSQTFPLVRVASPTVLQRLSDTHPAELSFKHEKKVCLKVIYGITS